MQLVFRLTYVATFCFLPLAARDYFETGPDLSYMSLYQESSDDVFTWSEWSEWSDCTGNCSGGISRRHRECLFGYCTGPSVQYNTCNIEPCPEGTKDFRERQCEIFNDVQYSWIPVSPLPPEDECALICHTKGDNVTSRLSPTVLDGTPCRSGSRDMCLNGKCIPIGCNYEFNSTATLDRCMVCGGDNTTCKIQKGRQTSHLVDTGLEELLLLPEGTFSVKLVLKGATSVPGVKTEDGLEGINQNTRADPGRYTIGGVEVQYGRTKSGRYSIAIPDKLPQNFWVTMLRTKSFNDGDTPDKILYHYIAPVHYIWQRSEWSACSKSCAAGVQESTWRCQDRNTREAVEESNCKGRRPEKIVQKCNIHDCPPEWRVSPWSDCSSTCGGGVESRTVSCVRPYSEGVQYVNQDYCSTTKPSVHRRCNTQQCPRWQIVVDWSECSATCATGETIRTVRCLDYNGYEVPGCPLYAKPIERKQCHTRLPCLESPIEDPYVNYLITPKLREYLERPPSYSISAWGPCSVTCGTGIRSRNVTCMIFVSHTETLEERPESECEPLHEIKPNVTEVCTLPSCPTISEVLALKTTVDPDGYTTKFSRQISSSDPFNDYSSFSHELSFPSESPYSVDSEIEEDLVKFSSYDVSNSLYNERFIWQQRGYTECSRSCAGGIQEDVKVCFDVVDSIVVADIRCANVDSHSYPIRCNEEPCPAEWRALLYSDCSVTCGRGHKNPLKVLCIQVVDATTDDVISLSDSQCQDLAYPDMVPCPNIDCRPHWVMETWSACTEVCGSGTKSRLVSCKQVLRNGIEVDRNSMYCEGFPPPEVESCNEIDCPPSWLTGDFSECSVTCGQGQMVRPVKCIQLLANGETDILDNSACPQETAPSIVESCNEGVCFEPRILSNYSVFQQEEPKGRVYLTVGQRATMFTKTTLIVRCPTEGIDKPNIQWLKGSAVIPQNRNMRVRRISGGSLKFAQLAIEDTGVYTCQTGSLSENFNLRVVSDVFEESEDSDYRWTTGAWSPCTVSCGGGIQQRDVLCQHANRRQDSGLTNPSWCSKSGVQKPDIARICNRQPCTPHWVGGQWSVCSSNCIGFGRGIKTRDVQCMNGTGNYITDDECESVEGLIKPANVTHCQTDECIPMWHVSRWSRCSATCGEGMRKRETKCMYRHTRKIAQRMNCEMVSDAPPVIGRCKVQDCPATYRECTDEVTYCGLVAVTDLCNHGPYQQKCCATCALDSR